MYQSIYTVIDCEKKIAFKSFATKTIHGLDNSAGKKARKLQGDICKLFGLKNDGLRISVHVNIFNDIAKEKILF